MDAPTLVYDGDCGFCTWCADFVRRRIPTSARVVPWQNAELDALGLSVAECREAVQWVDAGGTRVAGPDAIARLLANSAGAWRAAGRTLGTRPIGTLAWPVYRWVARNRDLMPGGTAACAMPRPDRVGRTRTGRTKG